VTDMTPHNSENRPLARATYEALRVVLREDGYDPELALEDEGYGVGVNQPPGVKSPCALAARRYIDAAKERAKTYCGRCGKPADSDLHAPLLYGGHRYVALVPTGKRSPHCAICSMCLPSQPCRPDCHVCWPSLTGKGNEK
jgi:hypothetical protein